MSYQIFGTVLSSRASSALFVGGLGTAREDPADRIPDVTKGSIALAGIGEFKACLWGVLLKPELQLGSTEEHAIQFGGHARDTDPCGARRAEVRGDSVRHLVGGGIRHLVYGDVVSANEEACTRE